MQSKAEPETVAVSLGHPRDRFTQRRFAMTSSSSTSNFKQQTANYSSSLLPSSPFFTSVLHISSADVRSPLLSALCPPPSAFSLYHSQKFCASGSLTLSADGSEQLLPDQNRQWTHECSQALQAWQVCRKPTLSTTSTSRPQLWHIIFILFSPVPLLQHRHLLPIF
jgi:hypothetical protein